MMADGQTQYELKQYKKGLKAADTILKKFPNHGGQSLNVLLGDGMGRGKC